MQVCTMANPDDESKSDGLEILSIGTLYVGPWEKKYWSSSRGKDRYPYPVGYQALRTDNGRTYSMEIYEGPKGPKFQITSNNKHSGSGDTPDRAWENFHKKCSRIKLWHGKRFTGKVDGVEFFGFKNALVQRLLRELVATVNGASEQSSLCDNFNENCVKGSDTGCRVTDKCPDLMSYLGRNTVTGKRTRTCKGVDLKLACKSSPRRDQLQQQDDDSKVFDYTPPKTKSDELTVSCTSGENNDISHAGGSGTVPVSTQKELRNDVIPSALAFEASNDSKVEPCVAEMRREFPSSEVSKSASSVNFNIQEERPLDRQLIELQGDAIPVTSDGKKDKAQVLSDFLDSRSSVLNDSQPNHCGDLYAPDTLDTQQEIASPDSGNHRGEKSMKGIESAAAADLIMSEEPVTGSHSEEGNSYLNGNSERNDFDSAGEEVAKSMMNVLLPLLTYSSRKKRRKSMPLKGSSVGEKLENELKGTVPSSDVMCPGTLADPSLEGTTKEHASGVCTVPLLENVKYIVPDSLDDQCEGHVVDHVLSSIHNAEAVISDTKTGKHETSRKGSSVVVDAIETFHSRNQINEVKEISSHEELLEDSDEQPQKYSGPTLHPSKGCASPFPLDLVPPSKDNCLTADAGLKPLEICSERTELENAPTFEGLKLIPLSAKQQYIHCDAIQDPKLTVAPVMGKYTTPFSESIICRNVEDTGRSEFYVTENMVAPDSFQFSSSNDGGCCKASFGTEGGLGGQVPLLQNENNHDALAPDTSHHVLHDQTLVCKLDKNDTKLFGGNLDVGNSEAFVDFHTTVNQHSESANHSVNQARGSANNVSHVSVCQDDNHQNAVQKQKPRDVIDRSWKIIGCYSHPVQISSVILRRKAHEINICVSYGLPEERKRDLLLYKIDAKEPSVGIPSMVAHTSIYLPILKDEFYRQVAVDKTGVQFTPDATGLVIADSIKTPYCREKNLHCICPQCESCCFEENAIKIIQVKFGYVSVVLKLKTIHPLHCVLVCEPEHLIALDESGIIYIWLMNPTWSVQSEEYFIPTYDFLPSRVVDLKRIPRSASMVVGHNGYGEFSLWDITKRSVISRFSAPTNSALEFVPVSLFSWQNKSLQSHNKPVTEECVKKLLETTMSWFSSDNEANVSCPMDGKNVAVWLFISTSSDSQSRSSSDHESSDGCWRLGLLIKNRMILGNAVPASTSAIGTAAGHGIIGTNSGHAYIWELATASKLKTLHDFAGGGVSHIFTDDSTSSAVAIVRDAKLWVYLQT